MSSLHSLQEHVSKIPGPLGWILAFALAILSWLIDVAEHGLAAWQRISIGLPGWDLYLPTLSQITPAGIAAGIIAIAGALVVGLGQLSRLYIHHKKELDTALKETLSGQLAEIQASLEQSRKNHHTFRNEAAARDARNQLEIERLHKEVLARDERHNAESARFMELMAVLQADNDRLRQEVARLQQTSRRVEQTTKRIEEKADRMSSDTLPTYPPKRPDSQG